MFQILICDDDPVFLDLISEKLNTVFIGAGFTPSVHGCGDGEGFSKAAAELKPEIVFMDLQLGSEDGYELCKAMRESGSKAEIVFITNYPERMSEAFPHRPIGFIPKDMNLIDKALEDIPDLYLRYHAQAQTFLLNTRSEVKRIPYADIVYFESKLHSIEVKTAEGTYTFRAKLDRIASEAETFGFARIHQSYLVNLQYAAGIERKNMQLKLRSGEVLPISKHYYADCLQLYVDAQL